MTLTIGGNNIGFVDFATSCVLNNGIPPFPPGGCDTTGAYTTILGKIQFNLPGELNDAFEEIEDNIGAQTKVLVVGYPLMIPEQAWDSSAGCPWLDAGEKEAAREVITRLNAALQTAVTAVNNVQQVHRFEYVDPNYSGSPFLGHELCTGDSYFNGPQLPQEYSLHPNSKGQHAYTEVILHHLGVLG